MYYIKDADYEFISNKYRDQKNPGDTSHRFVRNDSIFSEDTGTDPNKILEGIYENDKKYENLPHSIRKARAMEYVLENTRILCDSRDIFPAINCIDRPLAKTLIGDWEKEVFTNIIPDSKKEMDFLKDRGIARTWLDYDHSVPVWDRLLSFGFAGILKSAAKARALLQEKTPLTEEQTAFYDSIQIVYEAIIRFIGRLIALAEKSEGCENMAKALKNIQYGVPCTFYEAMLFEYIYFMVSEHIDSIQARSLGNFDRLFYPYYKKDLESGVSEETLKTQLAYFLYQFSAIGNYWGQPVYLGGTDEKGDTNINPLSYIFLDIYDKLGVYSPKNCHNVIMIDEIQLCDKFELAINSLHAKGLYDIYLTGSNAFLLSSDLATLFTGRVMEIKVFPFSFEEYVEYFGAKNTQDAFDEYVRMGGMSGSYFYKTDKHRFEYIKDVYTTILERDLVKKYKIRNRSEFLSISEFMMDNIGNLLSPNNVCEALNRGKSEITRKTVDKYIKYLENAFMFYEAKRYDLKGKKYLETNKKYYICDSSFRYAVNGTKDLDFGRVYENIVYLELLRRGYEVYIGKLYKKEIDFVAIKRDEKIYIQVSDNISDAKTMDREISPLLQIRDAYPKMIIARTRHEDYQRDGVHVTDISNWLLNNKS